MAVSGSVPDFVEWIRRHPPPDLQALAALYGGISDIPDDRWREFTNEVQNWLNRVRIRDRDKGD